MSDLLGTTLTMIDPPHASDEPSVLADWLELVTIFSSEKIGRVNVLLDSTGIAQDSEHEDIADGDTARDCLAEDIAEEIIQRRSALEPDAYPFEMSADGESLRLVSPPTYGHSAYIACLMISQSWSSGKLVPPAKLSRTELDAGRMEFEVMSAVAAVGLARGGPSFLLGTNRHGAKGLQERVTHVCHVVGEARGRKVLHSAAPESPNDDGVDVLAVELEADGPPHRGFWFCQAAAGMDYQKKPILNVIPGFLEVWFAEQPLHAKGALFLPATLRGPRATYLTRRLGHLCHRLRMPRYAQLGFDLIGKQEATIHYVENVCSPIAWLESCLARIQAAL